MSLVDIFLSKLKEKYPDSDPKALWERANIEIRSTYCDVMIRGEFKECGMEKVDGLCPYHRDSNVDFLRTCEYINDNNRICGRSVSSRVLDVVWCDSHLGGVDIKLRRVGDFVVIRGTPYVISDDMLSIIGRVGMNERLEFYLNTDRDDGMEEVSKKYKLFIRLD